ncbi:MAG TPA: M14 family metallopeptidase [Ramlibacter sp.]|nr:M14 family metallopeptidase [Ramlibacter sp.]
MTLAGEEAFAATYREARQKFIEAAQAAGLAVESKSHPMRGREGEELAMDVVRDGHPNAPAVLLLTSGCHGVEGFCGSGVQVAALRDASWRARARERGVAVVYVHALNPFGFSHVRRTTHENIDLNRNFHDFDQPLPDNAGYRELHPLLLPEGWPPAPENELALGRFIATHGEAALQAVVSRGQHEFPDGLFFGGTVPSWSNLAIRDVLRTHGHRCARLAWIDFHTGLGPNGIGERIFAGRNDPIAIARAKAWWDSGGSTPVTSIYDGSSTSAFLTGLMCGAADEECPQAEFTSIALEYGTVPMMETTQALRGAHWLANHPDADPQLAQQVTQRMRDAFYTDTPEWKQKVLAQARQAMRQAVDGLAA